MTKVHIAYDRSGPVCGAGKRWPSSVVTTVRQFSEKVTCRSCIRHTLDPTDAQERAELDRLLAR